MLLWIELEQNSKDLEAREFPFSELGEASARVDGFLLTKALPSKHIWSAKIVTKGVDISR